MEENPFFTIQLPNITIILATQKPDNRTPSKFMGILWNPGGDSISIKRNTTISYINESDDTEKSLSDQLENVREIAEVSQDKLPPMPEKSAFMFHHNFYPKPKVKLEDAIISGETKSKLQELKQHYNDIVSQHSSDIGLTHLEEMIIKMDQELPPVVNKLYPLPLKHHTFIKEETENLLEVGLITRSMSPPYTVPIIVVPRKGKTGTPLAETKRIVTDYRQLNKLIPKVQMTQTKSKGSLALIEMGKLDHIWSRLKGEKYFTILDIKSGYHHILIYPDSRPKTAFTCPYGKF